MNRHRAFLAVLQVLCLTGASRAEDLPEIRSRGALRVLAVVSPPSGAEFFSETSGRGFDREILEGFARLQRLRFEHVRVATWDVLVSSLVAGQGDLIAGHVTATEARRRLIDFSAEVFPTRLVVFTRKPHRIVMRMEELRQEKVGTVKGTNLAEAVAAAKVPSVDDTVPAGGLYDALRQGRITAAVMNVENVMAAKRKDPELQLGMLLGPPGSLAYGVRKGDTALLQALNAYIENVRKTPTWNRLVVKYFGAEAPEVLKKAREE